MQITSNTLRMWGLISPACTQGEKIKRADFFHLEAV